MCITCPICHSDIIKYHKVFHKGRWWSRCISGIDHGVLVMPSGKEVDIGVTYTLLYFDDEGNFAYEGEDYIEGKIERQVLV